MAQVYRVWFLGRKTRIWTRDLLETWLINPNAITGALVQDRKTVKAPREMTPREERWMVILGWLILITFCVAR